MSLLAEDRVLVVSLRARTALLVAGAQVRKVPVDTGVLHGPVAVVRDEHGETCMRFSGGPRSREVVA